MARRFRIGGSSLNAIAVIMGLRKEGLFVQVSDFLSATSFLELLDRISAEPIDDDVCSLISKDEFDMSEYEYEPLQVKDGEEVVQFYIKNIVKTNQQAKTLLPSLIIR